MLGAMVVCRFVHFCAVLLLFGFRVFKPLLLRARNGGAYDRHKGWIERGLAWLALGSALVWLLLATHSMAGSWPEALNVETLWLVLGSTFFGHVWAAHVVINVLLLIVLQVRSSSKAGYLLGLLLLATLAPVGHGAMLEGWRGQLLMFNQFIHLVCVGAWLGGLLGLLLVLMRADRQDVDRVLRRFSSVSFVLVAGIILTGLINTRVLTGAVWPTPLFEGFALILLIKVFVVGVMLLLALFNLVMSRAGRFAVLRTSVTLEWSLGLIAVAAVSLLGTLPPLVIN